MKAIYLDYNATTPVAPEVLESILPFFSDSFGNAASITHPYGWDAEKAVNGARKQVADLIGANPQEIIFTSGATESNNWVVRGLIEEFRKTSATEPLHFITSTVEHSSVVNSFKWAARQPGITVDWAPVNKYGQVIVSELKKLIRPTTKLMSFMWVNNEIGSINPMAEISALAKEQQIYLHSDATQAVGKIPVSLSEIPIDLMSFSGHKIYAPKGVGALYIRSQNPKVGLCPMLLGGGHERGLRSGTLNVPGIVGLGTAAAQAKLKMSTDLPRLTQLRQLFESLLRENFPKAFFNGHPTERGPNTINVTFREYQVPSLIAGIAVSRGSACQSGSVSISQVLNSIGLSAEDAQNTMRISLGSRSTESEIYAAVECLKKSIVGLSSKDVNSHN